MITEVQLPVESVDVIRCVVGFRLSSPTVDRAGELVLPGAFDFTNHQKIPIALLGHDRSMPVGLCENRLTKQYTIRNDDSGYPVGEIWFNQDDYAAMRVFDACVQGVVRGVSPGFIAHEFADAAKKQYKRCELIEVSLCVIPENPDAVVTWVQKSLDSKQPELLKYFKQFMPETKVSMVTKEAEAPMKPGAKACHKLHTGLLALKAMIGETETEHDNAALSVAMSEITESIDSALENLSELYSKEYPDGPELKAADDAEHSLPIEEIKNLKTLERQFKLMNERTKALAARLAVKGK